MDREAALRAIGGGAVGTVVLSVFLLVLEAQTRSQVRVGAVVARYVGLAGEQSVAVAIFVLTTAVVWPLLFLALERRALLPGRTRGWRAVFFGTALAVAVAITGRGELEGPVLVLYGVGILGAHVAYGLTLARTLRPVAGTDADVSE